MFKQWFRRLFENPMGFVQYLIVLAACVVGVVDLPWAYGTIAPAVLLQLSIWPETVSLVIARAMLMSSGERSGAETKRTGVALFWVTMAASFVNSLFFCSLAFLFGHLVHYVFL